jgi:hypothetical protein
MVMTNTAVRIALVASATLLAVGACTVHHHHYYCKGGKRHPGAHSPGHRPGGDETKAVEKRCESPRTLDLAELVRKVGLAPRPDIAYAGWPGKCVTARARVFNVEVDTKTRIYRILFDPPGETRGVSERMGSGGRVLMLTCTSPSRRKFLWLRRGDTVQVTGGLTTLDTTNSGWLTSRLKGCSIRKLAPPRPVTRPVAR